MHTHAHGGEMAVGALLDHYLKDLLLFLLVKCTCLYVGVVYEPVTVG